MSAALARILERVRQHREAVERTLRAARPAPPAAEHPFGRPLVAGDRVVDLVTGEEGVVIGRTAENVIVPAAQQ